MPSAIVIRRADEMLDSLFWKYPHAISKIDLIDSNDPGNFVADSEAFEILLKRQWIEEHGADYKITPDGRDVMRLGGYKKIIAREVDGAERMERFRALGVKNLLKEVRDDLIYGEGSIDVRLGNIKYKISDYPVEDGVFVLEELLKEYQKKYDEHEKHCQEENPEDCEDSRRHIKYISAFTNHLRSLKDDNVDWFTDITPKDRQVLRERIDEVLNELQALKLGQEIIWTDLMDEMNEMKEHFSLNKKNWRQLLAGKIKEMVIAGVISETVSKKIVEMINPSITNLLTNK